MTTRERAAPFVRSGLGVGLALWLGACAAGTPYVPPASPLGDKASASPAAHENGPWWQRFGDPVLDRLETLALSANPDIDAALARLEQARAAAGASRAGLLPAAQANLQAAHQRASIANSNRFIAGYLPTYQRDGSLYDATAGASWELDVFGGLRRTDEAARAELGGAGAGIAAARMMVAADLADHYVALRTLQHRLALMRRQIAAAERAVQLSAFRVEAGASARSELEAQRARLDELGSAEAQLQAGLAAERTAILILLGRAPGSSAADLDTEGPVPTAPDLVAGAPADLLRRRPDIVAAERKLAAAHARVGAALSDYYPKVSLQGLSGFESLFTRDLFSTAARETQGAAALRWRLFDFGRVDAEVAAARGKEKELLAAWRASVLRAAGDVENGLAAQAAQTRSAAALGDGERSQARIEADAAEAWRAGQASESDLMEARLKALAAEDKALAARGDQTRATIAVARALGLSAATD